MPVPVLLPPKPSSLPPSQVSSPAHSQLTAPSHHLAATPPGAVLLPAHLPTLRFPTMWPDFTSMVADTLPVWRGRQSSVPTNLTPKQAQGELFRPAKMQRPVCTQCENLHL